jgi:FKBP-type peptidyl-prolyl cis-trans isomerase 2
MPVFLEPGQRVRHPERPDWGIGQVQSVIGDRVTVNFEHAGKLLINAAVVALETVPAEDPPPLAPGGDAGPNA